MQWFHAVGPRGKLTSDTGLRWLRNSSETYMWDSWPIEARLVSQWITRTLYLISYSQWAFATPGSKRKTPNTYRSWFLPSGYLRDKGGRSIVSQCEEIINKFYTMTGSSTTWPSRFLTSGIIERKRTLPSALIITIFTSRTGHYAHLLIFNSQAPSEGTSGPVMIRAIHRAASRRRQCALHGPDNVSSSFGPTWSNSGQNWRGHP